MIQLLMNQINNNNQLFISLSEVDYIVGFKCPIMFSSIFKRILSCPIVANESNTTI